MAVGDVYEIVDVQTLQGQEIQNVYFYQQQTIFVPLSGNTATALAADFAEIVVPQVADVQSVDLIHVEVRCRNLFNATDAGSAVSGQAGLQTDGGDFLPSFSAWGFQLTTDNASVRDGAKRIAGVPEFLQEDGVPVESAITALNTLADNLALALDGGTFIPADIFFPIIVKRVRTGLPGSYVYELPDNSGDLVFGLILEALVKLFITSQVSRKFGVGI